MGKKRLGLLLMTLLVVLLNISVQASSIDVTTPGTVNVCVGNQYIIDNYIGGELVANYISSNMNVASVINSRDIRSGLTYDTKRLISRAPGRATITSISIMGRKTVLTVVSRKHKLKKGKCVYCGRKSDKQITKELTKLKKKKAYKDGAKWGSKKYRSVSDRILGVDISGGYGCVAFVIELADKLYKDLPIEKTRDVNSLKPGDIVRLDGKHSVMIWKKSGSKYVLAEANVGGRVAWGRKVSKSYLRRHATYICVRGVLQK